MVWVAYYWQQVVSFSFFLYQHLLKCGLQRLDASSRACYP